MAGHPRKKMWPKSNKKQPYWRKLSQSDNTVVDYGDAQARAD